MLLKKATYQYSLARIIETHLTLLKKDHKLYLEAMVFIVILK